MSWQVDKNIEKHMQAVLEFCVKARSAKEIREYLQLSSRNYVNNNIIKPLISQGLLDYTNKKNTRASNQKYIITP